MEMSGVIKYLEGFATEKCGKAGEAQLILNEIEI